MFSVINMTGNPCTKDCTARCENCKSTCNAYEKFSQKIKKAREEYNRQQNMNSLQCEYLRNHKDRVHKGMCRKMHDI